ncbi:MAG: GspH/FimT family pseudopilin [Candidatus Latescibacterota bacterium]|nr:MAG: GspH/FimT family pseudopilin [Candidatus Latescibacterota bacterium]
MHLVKSRGFTLVELMFVVLVIGLMLLMSLPGFGRFLQTWKLHGEIDRMASTMRAARSAAIMKNIDAVFQFDVIRGTYSYFEDEDGDGSRDNDEYRSATHNLPPGITFDSHTFGATTITFGPRGNTTQSGSITMGNTLHKTRQLSLFGGTGNIKTGS